MLPSIRFRYAHIFPKIVLALCLATAVSAIIATEKPAYAATAWRALAQGLEYRAISLAPANAGAYMHQFRLSPSHYRLTLTKAAGHGNPVNTISALRRQARAILAINGGYFAPDNAPLGYQRCGSQIICPDIAYGAAFTGVFRLDGQNCRLFHRDDYSPGTADFVLQAGPRLITEGEPTSGLHSKSTRLSGIGVDTSNRILLYSTDFHGFITMAQCQRILLGPTNQGGVSPRYVMNLDGGRSAGISVAVSGFSLERPSFSHIPVAITVTRRH